MLVRMVGRKTGREEKAMLSKRKIILSRKLAVLVT
jgi:hypothetical protein